VIDGERARVRWDFFISYTRVNQAWAEWISFVLEEAGYKVLVQAWDSTPGRNWPRFIRDGIRDAAAILVVLTPEYLASEGGSAEWEAVWASDLRGDDRRLVPVLIEPSDDRDQALLATRTWIDLSDLAVGSDEAEAGRRLIKGVVEARAGRAKPTVPPGFPRRPAPGPAGAARALPSPERLPGLPARFVGRDGELSELRRLLTDPMSGAVVGLVGIGGAGKSTLARAAVRDDAIRAAYPDGIVWVEVNPEPDLVTLFSTVLSAFGSTSPVTDVAEGSARLRTLLAGAAALIVLDNVWDVEVLRALPVSLPSRLLVTSRGREALFTDSAVQPVRQLDGDGARRLLARYAGCEPEELPPDSDLVIERCGGLPLALALAGGMVSEGRRWAAVADCLRRADLDRLAGEFPDYPYPNLLAALEVSVTTLGEPDATRFRELVVFEGHGQVPVTAAYLLWWATSEVSELDADDLLIRLGRRSLVELAPGGDMFTLHDLLFDYARHSVPAALVTHLHCQLAQSFLDRWGGLLPGMPALKDFTQLGGADLYGVDHVIYHLLASYEPELVDAVITAEWPRPEGGADNVWYTVHESLGRTDNYLADIRAAWRNNRTDPTTASGFHRQAPYALIIGSVTSIAANIPSALLVRLVEESIWQPRRALAYAQATPAADRRALALSGLAPHLPADQRTEILTHALTDAVAINDGRRKAVALSCLAPHLSHGQLLQALATATAIDDPWSQANALGGLAPHLTPDQLTQALNTAIAIKDPHHLANTLGKLAPSLPGDQRAEAFTQVLTTIAAIKEIYEQSRALTILSPHLTSDQVSHALDLAYRMEAPYYQTKVLSSLAPHLTADQIDQVRNAATALDPATRSDVVSSIAPYLLEEQRTEALRQTFASAMEIDELGDKIEALYSLAPHLTADQLNEALSVVNEISSPGYWTDTLGKFALHLTPDQLNEALGRAATVADPALRAQAFISVAVRLTPNQVGQALSFTAAIKRPYVRERALGRLAPHLTPDQLNQALTIATAIDDSDTRADAVSRLAPHLTPDQLNQALATTTAINDPRIQAEALSRLAPHLTPDQLNQALATTTAINDPLTRAEAVSGLATYLSEDGRVRAVGEILNSSIAVSDLLTRARVITSIAPHLTPDQLSQAVTIATRIRELGARTEALSALAPYLPCNQRTRAVRQALKGASSVTYPYSQARIIGSLAPHLDPKQLDQALTIAHRIGGYMARPYALSDLFPHLPVDERAKVFLVLLNVDEPIARTPLLRYIASHLSADQRAEALTHALTDADGDPALRVLAFGDLAPHLAADERAKILSEALLESSSISRTSVVQVIAGALTAGRENGQRSAEALIQCMRWWP